MKIGTKIVQKRSEMFGPVGFPIGGWIGASAAGDSEPKSVQNRSGFKGVGFLIFEFGSEGGAANETENRTDLKCQVVQKWCGNGAVFSRGHAPRKT